MRNEPEKPAKGRNGHWLRLGCVSVDSCRVGIVDPAYVQDLIDAPMQLTGELHDVPDPGCAVRFLPGFGDGGYTVWGWVVDYGDPHDPSDVDERIAQIVMTFIDAADLADWHRPNDQDSPGAAVYQKDSDLFTVTGPREWLRRFQEGEQVSRVQAAEDESEWVEVSMTQDELNRLYQGL